MVVGVSGPALNGRPRTKMRAGKGQGSGTSVDDDDEFEITDCVTGLLPQGDTGGAGGDPASDGGGDRGEGLRPPQPDSR